MSASGTRVVSVKAVVASVVDGPLSESVSISTYWAHELFISASCKFWLAQIS